MSVGRYRAGHCEVRQEMEYCPLLPWTLEKRPCESMLQERCKPAERCEAEPARNPTCCSGLLFCRVGGVALEWAGPRTRCVWV